MGRHQVSFVHVVGAMCCASADQGHGALGGWAVYFFSFILAAVVWFGAFEEKKIRKNNGNGALGVPRSNFACDTQRTPRRRSAFGCAENYARAQGCTGNMRIAHSRRRGGITGACMHGLDLIFGVMISYRRQQQRANARDAPAARFRACVCPPHGK